MMRTDGTLECQWCHDDALWNTSTPRHEHLDLCQRHYDDLAHERRADILSRLSGEGLAIAQAFHNWRVTA